MSAVDRQGGADLAGQWDTDPEGLISRSPPYGSHLGQRSWHRTSKAGHMTASVVAHPPRFLRASRGPSTHEILASYRASPVSRRLARIPGVGPVIATAIVATVPDPSVFRSGREFAAWLGLVPRQRSTGGKQRMGRISRQGDRYIRRLLIVGAQSALLRSKEIRDNAWVQGLLARCARLKVAVALANKTARIAWKLMVSGERYDRARAARRTARVHQGDGRHPPSATAARRGGRASDGGSEGMASRPAPAIMIGGAAPREA